MAKAMKKDKGKAKPKGKRITDSFEASIKAAEAKARKKRTT